MRKIHSRYAKLIIQVAFIIYIYFTSYLFPLISFQGASVVTKRTVKSSEPTSAASSVGLDGLPREDISGKVTPTLLKGLESTDWKVIS